MRAYKIQDQSHCYFLTLTVVNWIDVFSRKNYRDIIIDSLDYCQKHKGLTIFGYVIMTNHTHLLARSEHDNLSSILRDFKSFTSKEILKHINLETESRRDWMLSLFKGAAIHNERNASFQIWTHDNRAINIYSNKFLMQKLNYIHMNPVRAGFVAEPQEYLYSSATNYAGLPSLLDIITVPQIWKTIN